MLNRPTKEVMSKRERAEATINLQETDRVAVYDLLFNDAAIEYFTGRPAPAGQEGIKVRAQAAGRMLDMTRCLQVPPQVPRDFEDNFGIIHRVNKWQDLGIVKRPFDDVAGAKRYTQAVIESIEKDLKNGDLKKFAADFQVEYHQIKGYVGDDTVVMLYEAGPGIDWLRAPLGMELFSYLYADEPEIIGEYLELYTQRDIARIHTIADSELSPVALTYGDIACKNQLLHSPAFLQREFFPRLKRIQDAFHEHDIKCLYHSDGYVMEILPDLIATGIDGLNPVETVAGMDLSEVKSLYGNKIFIAGSIDISQLMANGTPDEVRQICRQHIDTAYPGYFIGSTTELDNGSRLENILAMLDTAWNYSPRQI